jgi:hypothetical protein
VQPPDQVAELWRAATADRDGVLRRELADPLLARAADIAAASSGDPRAALEQYDRDVAESRSANFALEFGRRALARAALHETGVEGFGAELFAEATSYYVARDLPGFVGSPGRVQGAKAALTLKADLQKSAREIVSTATPATEPKAWVRYVDAALERLTGWEKLR